MFYDQSPRKNVANFGGGWTRDLLVSSWMVHPTEPPRPAHDDCLNKSPRCFLASLESIGLSVQEKKQEIDFQDGCHGSHLGFPIGMILVIFDLQVTPMLPSKFGVNWPFISVQEKKWKIDFQDGHHGSHLGFLIGTILAIFDLQVTPMLPSKFGVNWPFGSGEEAKNRFSRWPQWRPAWISNRHDFSYFWSTSHPDAS